MRLIEKEFEAWRNLTRSYGYEDEGESEWIYEHTVDLRHNPVSLVRFGYVNTRLLNCSLSDWTGKSQDIPEDTPGERWISIRIFPHEVPQQTIGIESDNG